MALDDGPKAAIVRQLAGFLAQSARLQGARVALWEVGDGLHRLRDGGELRLDGHTPALFERGRAVAAQLPMGGQRVVISDFMNPEPVVPLLRALGRGAAQLVVVRVLGPWEAAPPVGSRLTLRDAETGAQQVLRIAPAVRERYLGRLEAIGAALRDGCAQLGAVLVDVVVRTAEVRDVLRECFLPLGLVVPA